MTWRPLSLVGSLWLGFACGSPTAPSTTTQPDGGERPLSVVTVDAGCAITIETWAPAAGTHVPVGSTITWPSNPPSSGAHFPVWAAFQEFTSPVPRGYTVHDLEHGAVVFSYNCALVSGDCGAVTGALRQAAASLPDDPLCSGGVRVRTVLTPDPLLADPLVSTAWGFIYRAKCVDQASLEAFAAAHYAQAPENECANGVTQF